MRRILKPDPQKGIEENDVQTSDEEASSNMSFKAEAAEAAEVMDPGESPDHLIPLPEAMELDQPDPRDVDWKYDWQMERLQNHVGFLGFIQSSLSSLLNFVELSLPTRVQGSVHVQAGSHVLGVRNDSSTKPRSQGTRKINDPIFMSNDAPNDTPQLECL